MGQNGFGRLHGNSPFVHLPVLLERLRQETPNIVVDFHAQASAEKKTLFFAADGRCSAVIGSHTRVQTADGGILSGGTAVLSDAGRTGSSESVGGCETASRIAEYMTGVPDWTKDAWGKPELQGVIVEIGVGGKAISIETIRIAVDTPPANPHDSISDKETAENL